MNFASPASRAGWPLWVGMVLCLGACGGKKAAPHPTPETDATLPIGPPPGKDAGSPQSPDVGAGGAGGAPAPDASADAPIDRGADRPADGPRDSSLDLPSGPQALGAVCELPGGGMLPCLSGGMCCKPCCDGRPAVCTRPVQNGAGIGVGKCPLPDLTVSASALRNSLGLGPTTFSSASCEAREACVETPGVRNSLHFEVTTPNIGTSDLVLGSPLAGGTSLGSGFLYSRCHDHYHFAGYALYQLMGADGKEVLQGKKRAFCLEDIQPVDGFPLPQSMEPKFDCNYQGIQMGWADTYHNGLTCQFMDVTGVPPGQYTLKVTVNPDRIFPELSYDNNSVEVSVSIPARAPDPTQACLGMVPGLNRECGWRQAGSYDCMPGARVNVGCGAECGLGTSNGDPQIRVCPGETPCAWPGLGGNDDCTPSDEVLGARVTVLCPAGGRITVMTGPAMTGDPVSCNVQVR